MVQSFKAGDTHYEFFHNGEYSEIYEKENPKDGLVFETRKQLISFINHLTDYVEEVK